MDNIFNEYRDGLEVERDGFTFKIQECPDDDADLSYYGEFGGKMESELSIEHQGAPFQIAGWFNPENVENETQAQENYQRVLAYHRDEWHMMGIKVVVYKAGVRLGDASLWGIESDGDESYFLETANDLTDEALMEAKATLARLAE